MLIKVSTLLAMTRLGLSVLPYRTVQRLLDGIPQRRLHVADEAVYKRQLLWAVRTAGWRLLGDRPCLPQALVVRRLFRQIGKPPELRIGVAKGEGGRLIAHAWVECEGEVVVGGRHSPTIYTRLLPLHERLSDVTSETVGSEKHGRHMRRCIKCPRTY